MLLSYKNDVIKDLLFYILTLTGFFVLLEISFFIQCNRVYLGDFSFVSHQLDIPLTTLPSIFYFVFAHLMIHLLFCIIVCTITLLIAYLFLLNNSKMIVLGIIIWVIGMMTALVTNESFYPHSKFSELMQLILPTHALTQIVLYLLWTICSFLLLLSFIGFIKLCFLMRFWIISLVIVVATSAILLKHDKTSVSVAPKSALLTANKPNVIMIGVDSLRPDFLGFFGHDTATPFLDAFLNHAIVFSEAVTPLARTFPSWTSILTGLYPREIGVRFNLAQQDKLDLTESLPAILKRHGYETIYATDETRFSNIGKNYGFDKLITPKMGLNDFLLGTFNDFPFSNLILNTSIGQYLFPYSYANRPVYFTYNPDSFLSLLSTGLKTRSEKPLMLVVHFCLTHTPYLWAGSSANDANIVARYQQSILRVDQQLKDFFTLLKDEHLLDHAIVVLLSDHGEALELPGDRITEKDLFVPAKATHLAAPRFYPPSIDKEDFNQSVGHGTDVLSLTQYHTVLAFRLYGCGRIKQGVEEGIVSLLAIKPSLLELLHLPLPSKNTLSLAKIINGESSKEILKHIFLESDFTPQAIRTVYPETRKVMLEGIHIFQINPLTTQLTVKDAMGKMIIHSKQYADIYGHWILALYPQNNHLRMPILVNLRTGEWTNNLQAPLARHSPAKLMLEKLKGFYGEEIEVDAHP